MTSDNEDVARPAPVTGSPFHGPKRLWSLRDMMNFMLSTYVLSLESLRLRIKYAKARGAEKALPDDKDRKDVASMLRELAERATELEMPGVLARVERTKKLLKTDPLWADIATHLGILLEAYEDDTDQTFVYAYPHSKAKMVERAPKEWAAAFKAFPSIEEEAELGIDCFALDHNTACVFHMCRVAEVGLRMIGLERGVTTLKRGVPIEWGTWGQVFQAIEPTIADIRKTKPNGPIKDEALSFYDTILGDLRTIQSLFRDQTMHLRDRYDPGEAQTAIFRTREVMNKLASKLDENSTGPIAWGF